MRHPGLRLRGGGVGGLLVANDGSGSYFAGYDGNGNLTAYVSATAGVGSASYEYSSFGETLTSNGVAKDAFPFKFSTKYAEVESALLYYGLRYYSPTSGRWINRDPIEERGGINIYTTNTNDLINSIDALGLYELDVHRFLTEFLARHAGFCLDSTDIGMATQALDDPLDSRDAMNGKVIPMNRKNMTDFHFVTAARLAELRQKAEEACKCSGKNRYKPIGEYIHALEDTYSHSTGVGDRNWIYYGHPYGFGHGPQHHDPDWTWRDLEKADKMAEEVFNNLKDLSKTCGNKCPVSEWGDIKDQVHEFNNTRPASYFLQYKTTPFGPVNEVTFESYQTKVNVLDSTFEIPPYYQVFYHHETPGK